MLLPDIQLNCEREDSRKIHRSMRIDTTQYIYTCETHMRHLVGIVARAVRAAPM